MFLISQMSGIANLSSNMPAVPNNADFPIYIEFGRETPNPERNFQVSGSINLQKKLR